MTRKFKIVKVNYLPNEPWIIRMNGYDMETFRTWDDAMSYLIRHWYCECLYG